jgi:hypothetical protein
MFFLQLVFKNQEDLILDIELIPVLFLIYKYHEYLSFKVKDNQEWLHMF